MNQPVGVQIAVEVDAGSVRRGDQLMVGGQCFTVEDMVTMAHGSKRLLFTSGESFTMRPTTVLWASRRASPRLRRGGQPPRL